LQRLTRFARTFQLILVGWLWGLLVWSTWGTLDLLGAEPLLEVVVVWITLFTGIEILNRFRLGRIRWNGGSALDKLKGVSAVLTEVEVTEMRSNSTDIMSGLRWVLHGVTMVWLCALLVLGTGDSSESIGFFEQWSRPTLWLASLYALVFVSETWLRLRGRMPV
jgi:hypothetical protein